MEVNYHQEIKKLGCKLLIQIRQEKPLDGRLEEPGRHRYEGFLIIVESLSKALLGGSLPPRTRDSKFRILSFREFVREILRGYPPYFNLLREKKWWGWSENLILDILDSKEHFEGLIRYLEASEKRSIGFQRRAIYLAQRALEGGFTPEDYLKEPEDFPHLLANYSSRLRRRAKTATPLPREKMLQVLESCYSFQEPTSEC